MTWRKCLALHFLLGFSFFLLFAEWEKLPDGNLHIVMMNVGQGEALLITTPGYQQVLIDGGPGFSVLEELGDEMPFFDRNIELVVLTHPDADHATGLVRVLRRYNVQNVLMTGVIKNSPRYEAFLDAVRENGARVIIAESDRDIDLGAGVALDILWPVDSMLGEELKRTNNSSIVAKLTWKNHEIMLTGDIEKKVENELFKQPFDLTADIIKVPHHGSKTSSSTGFLVEVNPELALVSAERGNRFGHPAKDVVARYEHFGIPIRSTTEEGRIEVVLY